MAYTPSLYVIDPANGRVAASHFGGLSLAQLEEFLDRGARGVRSTPRSPPDSALARGDEFLGQGQLGDAETAYRRALDLGGSGWDSREEALAQLTWTLMTDRQSQASAAMAVAEAPKMTRTTRFVRVVLAGLLAANSEDSTSWAVQARGRLVPLASEAAGLAVTARNDRFQLYQEMMIAADLSGDKVAMGRWGERWLGEIERTVPRNEDERTALDVARVDAVGILGTPARAIPALEASERAMPHNYNACLRLAQVYRDSKRYDDAIAACDRGLARVNGPLGRTWLLETKADALLRMGDRARAREVLEDARMSANAIVLQSNRDGNLRRITAMMADAAK